MKLFPVSKLCLNTHFLRDNGIQILDSRSFYLIDRQITHRIIHIVNYTFKRFQITLFKIQFSQSILFYIYSDFQVLFLFDFVLKLSSFPEEVPRADTYDQIGKKRIENKKRKKKEYE